MPVASLSIKMKRSRWRNHRDRHVLKQTGSYEQASYAIQDTPEMVAQHYGRFLPQDKAKIAARILNKV